MTALLIFLRLLQLLEFLASSQGIMAGIWLGCYWLVLDLTTLGSGVAGLVATLCAWGYCVSEPLDS